MTTRADTNRDTVREFTRIFKNEHDVNRVAHLFHPEFKHHFRMPLPAGLEGFKAIGHVMNTAFPDVVVREADLVVTDDKVVERSDCTATHRGELMGVPASNKRVAWSEIHIYRMVDGKIAEHWAELSMAELMQQITAR
jgi:predicted ester cyclase